MEIRVLLVEDDNSIRDIVSKFLKKEGYEVDACSDGQTAAERIYDNNYHIVILDIMLPGTSGHELLKEYRKTGNAPVLMMTALDDEENQVRAFTSEADDYVTKPFSMQVLLKRVEALLRRSGALQKVITIDKLKVYTETHRIIYDETEIDLTQKEYDILLLLVQNKGRIVSHETLLTRIWGFDFEGNEGIVHATIKRLRDKFPENFIKTVKRVGYCIEGSSNEKKEI